MNEDLGCGLVLFALLCTWGAIALAIFYPATLPWTIAAILIALIVARYLEDIDR